MSQTDLINARRVLEEDLERDPEFRQFWERTAPARAVANSLVAYRIAHSLTQADLAARLGVKQPRIARLETGEHNPTWPTLWLLANRLGLSFYFGIAPLGAEHQGGFPFWILQNPSTFGDDVSIEEVTSPVTGTRAVVAAKVVDGGAE